MENLTEVLVAVTEAPPQLNDKTTNLLIGIVILVVSLNSFLQFTGKMTNS